MCLQRLFSLASFSTLYKIVNHFPHQHQGDKENGDGTCVVVDRNNDNHFSVLWNIWYQILVLQEETGISRLSKISKQSLIHFESLNPVLEVPGFCVTITFILERSFPCQQRFELYTRQRNARGRARCMWLGRQLKESDQWKVSPFLAAARNLNGIKAVTRIDEQLLSSRGIWKPVMNNSKLSVSYHVCGILMVESHIKMNLIRRRQSLHY